MTRIRSLAWMSGALATILLSPVASAQVKPRILIAFDTSGSMGLDLAGTPTFGDGVTTGCTAGGSGELCGANCTAGVDTNCDGLANDSRMTIAKAALRNMLYAFGDVDFALARFDQTQGANTVCNRINDLECTNALGPGNFYITSYGNPQCNAGTNIPAGACNGGTDFEGMIPAACRPGTGARPGFRMWNASSPTVCINYNGTCSGGDFLVNFPGVAAFAGQENTSSILKWIDDRETSPALAAQTDGHFCNHLTSGDCELRPSGGTPLAGLLTTSRNALTPIIAADTASSCRPYSVILLTDGVESCGGTPSTQAAALAGMGVDVYVIGFAVGGGQEAPLNAIATAGGTDAGDPGGNTAYFADNQDELSAGLAEIIRRSLRFETCNGSDDDCDTRVDEGFTLYCNRPAHAAQDLCIEPAETLCNSMDDDCDGLSDEGLRNACGTCGAVPTEVCNGLDDDCDGIIDDGGVCSGCVPSAEICDSLDNDCDTRIDESLSRACGTDVGECSVGSQTCSAGAWGTCSGTNPTAETCNNRDDNCDGIVDGISRACGSAVGECRAGSQLCAAGAWGTCSGALAGTTERCDGLDNDCDTRTDEATGGGTCGSSIGQCRPGTYACTGGTLVCGGGVLPGTESCNSADDDCDGATDESIPPNGACGTAVGECETGLLTCVSGAFVCTGQRTASTEACNGLDDDCDSSTDEGNPGGGAACGSDTGICTAGMSQCTGGALTCSGGTGPEMELCDLSDNDCDGNVDEGNPGGGASCGTTDEGVCEFGRQVCEAGMLVCRGASEPGTERCDGLDNDCDTRIDEGNPEGGLACGDETGECSAGMTTCTAGRLVCGGGAGPMDEMCNGLDDDCDGVADDGLGVGAPCGSDEGECVPGFQVCRDGAVLCEGATDSIDEVCDALDNDCDGVIDESIAVGSTCGNDEGLCEAGAVQCINGREVCSGSVPPNREVCDCEDNDCDGMSDEPPSEGSLCPSGSTCIECGCSLPCERDEFGFQCPTGKTPLQQDGMCFCVTTRCETAACATETVERDGNVLCGPGTENPTCVCKQNQCTFPCEGVVCTDGLVCDPEMGRCVENSCRTLGCEDGQRCDRATGACVADPCADVTCGATQACRDGQCLDTCVGVMCDDGQRCQAGVCDVDRCDGVSCAPTDYCNPATGACDVNECVGVRCATGQVCNPENGMCEVDPCETLTCPTGAECRAGECQTPSETPDGGVDDGGAGSDAGVDGGRRGTRVLATGAGGCACSVDTDENDVPSFVLALFGLWLVGRRRSRSVARRNRVTLKATAPLAIALVLGGCDVDPFCFDCEEPLDAAVDTSVPDASVPDTSVPDAGSVDAGDDASDARPDGCVDVETCNGHDDDCDGNTDEGLDLSADPQNCGACGAVCSPAHAFGTCESSMCQMGQCDVGWLDINQSLDDGCEYRCLPSVEDGTDAICDLRDDDCDGDIDEGVDLQNDPNNCGSCGRSCRFRHVTAPTCEAGACTYDASTGCDAGWVDLNGVSADGCEYSCTATGQETCNLRDDDCDGDIDEGNPGGGVACGSATGACAQGILQCNEGSLICMGATVPTTETCNGVDDDCDTSVDENNPEGGRACGTSTGSCEQGREECDGGALICLGATGPVTETCNGLDDDCDGNIDNGNPGGGASCGTETGECAAGALQCQSGSLTCVGAVGASTEICDGQDDDCDGNTDENNPGGGGSCGSDVGACSPGVRTCSGGTLVCTGATSGGAESCNGLDDDCDSRVDEGNPGGGASCGTDTGACVAGMRACVGGTLVCQGSVGAGTETCNSIDDDCDTRTDETFSFSSDLNNCGGCGVRCSYSHGVASCGAMGCQLAGCNSGFVNLDGMSSNGCEYACDVAGTEICNGRDDDCDGVVDDGVSPPANFCNPNGVCGGTAASCGGASGWQCNYPATYEPSEESCDGRDNDCDGSTDEPFPTLGTACSNGVGTCRRAGMMVCNGTNDAATCNAPAAGTPGTESCNNLDDDCDSRIDENPGTLIPTVTIPRASGGGNVQVMQYEASRPDATSSSSGSAAGYACSRTGVMPWVNVTWTEANAACTALGSGWGLCEESDWQRACQGPAYASTPCGYGYASACTTSAPLTCNGEEFDSNAGTSGDQDALYSTGAFAMCYAAWTGGSRIYDLSGNVKEWTATQRGTGNRGIRGGSFTNVEGGRRCDFNFTVAAENFAFTNTGFRCCRY